MHTIQNIHSYIARLILRHSVGRSQNIHSEHTFRTYIQNIHSEHTFIHSATDRYCGGGVVVEGGVVRAAVDVVSAGSVIRVGGGGEVGGGGVGAAALPN